MALKNFLNKSGGVILNCFNHYSALKDIAEGRAADCWPTGIYFYKVQVLVDFKDLDLERKHTIKFATYLHLPVTDQQVTNNNNVMRSITTYDGPFLVSTKTNLKA